MAAFHEIRALLYKEFKMDLKSANVLMSTVLYLFSSIFICYLSLGRLELSTWNAMLWILILFGMTNAANKIFRHEGGGQKYYLYTLASPKAIIMSKLIYQGIFSGILALMALFAWKTILNVHIHHLLAFSCSLLLGIWAMSNVLTLNNALAVETSNSPGVLAILSFPLMVPILLTSIRAGKLSLLVELSTELWTLNAVLVLLNLLTAGLSYLLFPYLWRY